MDTEFTKELTALLNKYSCDNACETPDHILAKYIENCLSNYCETMARNIAWHSKLEKKDTENTDNLPINSL